MNVLCLSPPFNKKKYLILVYLYFVKSKYKMRKTYGIYDLHEFNLKCFILSRIGPRNKKKHNIFVVSI